MQLAQWSEQSFALWRSVSLSPRSLRSFPEPSATVRLVLCVFSLDAIESWHVSESQAGDVQERPAAKPRLKGSRNQRGQSEQDHSWLSRAIGGSEKIVGELPRGRRSLAFRKIRRR